MEDERMCYNCKNYFKCCDKPKVKLFPYFKELTCYETWLDMKG